MQISKNVQTSGEKRQFQILEVWTLNLSEIRLVLKSIYRNFNPRHKKNARF